MLSLRLPEDQLARINALSRAQGLTRSQWLRRVVENAIAANDARSDPCQRYNEIMARAEERGALMGSGMIDRGRNHSVYVKEKLRAKNRR